MPRILAAAALCATALASSATVAAPAAQAVPPGHVYFWPDANQGGGTFDYTPGGYREFEGPLKRHAFSFDSHAAVSVYAISHLRNGDCIYREIRPDDYSDNWTEWGGKIDGVSDSTMGCQPG